MLSNGVNQINTVVNLKLLYWIQTYETEIMWVVGHENVQSLLDTLANVVFFSYIWEQNIFIHKEFVPCYSTSYTTVNVTV